MKNGNNTNVTTFRATSNPLLTCINVDDVAYSTANWTDVDASVSFNLNCSSVAPVIYIPDANFKAYLVGNTAINTDGDSEIQFSEAAAFTGKIDCYNISATSLVGVEEFINLTELDCSFNNIGSLDLTQNVDLESLDYSGTGLMSLDLSQNTALKTLLCASIATGSSLLSLDVSNNVNLESLSCDNNALTVLDLTQNTSLTTLHCYANQITSLDLSQNPNLAILNCSYNAITSLDISQNTNLVSFSCVENQLTSLDAKNGNNTIITFFGATTNPNLTCIKVDDVAYSTTNWTNIDATASFDANCIAPDPIVNIPDANFKAYLVGNTAINTDGDTEIQFSEATAFSGVINCPNSSIADLTGIEAFVNVTQLKCYNNSLTSLDVSQNTNLVVLHCVNNSISSLDVSQNTSLTQLFCSNNPISSLDVSQSTNLGKLYCGLTQITNLDVSQNTNLKTLDCTSSALSSLNVKNGNNTNFTTFKATNNPNLTCIEVDNPTYSTANWTNIDATSSFNSICIVAAPIVNIPDANFKAYLVANTAINTDGDAEIQVTEATAFTGVINCPNSNITDLTGIEAFVNLTQLKCYNNNLGSLDVSQNTSLTWIHCVNSSLSSLDVSQNTSLIWLYCSNNPINSLDLTQNTSLTKLYCSGAQLTTLNVKNGNNTNIATFKVTNNPNLTCIGVDDAAYSTTNWTDIDASASFSTSCIVLAPTVNIPDANFKAYLVGNTAINTDGDAEIQVSEATAFSGAINCSNLSITVLTGIEAFENLIELNCSSNTIGSLDLTQNNSLTIVDCSSNQLNNLTVKNGNNTNVTSFDATGNLSLSCIEVDNGTYSTTNWTNIDATASFSANCGAPTVNIPDANFKAYLVGNSAINTDGDGEIQVSEATAFNGVINCPGSNISDLTGIEAFVNVRQLKCYNNNISSLDLSQNTSLTWLHCVKNSISSLDLSQNTGLTWLYCSNNPIGSLDLTQNTSLTRLYCSATQLSSLTMKNGNNAAITTFQVTSNPNLTCIEVDDVAYSTANWADIDAIASFSTNCIVPMVNGSNANLGGNNTGVNANGAVQGSETSTNINTINKAINLKAYPNPATKEITLDFGKTYQEATIQVTNLTGQLVLSKTLTNSARATLELEGPTGIYFVSIQTEEGKATLKVIKE
jgi:Leucine-rich repeat (LRR) protein